MRFISIFAWTLATVAASPVPESEGGGLEERAASTCKTNKAYSILSSAGPRGSIYCSSVLSLTATTVTATAPPARTAVKSCPVGTRPKIAVAQAKRDEGSSLLEERQDGLAALGAGQITVGCECLNLPPKTITSTSPPTTTIIVKLVNGHTQTCTPV